VDYNTIFVVAAIYCSRVALYLAPGTVFRFSSEARTADCALVADMFFVIFNLLSVPTFWFAMPIVCIVCLLPDILWDLYIPHSDGSETDKHANLRCL